MKYAYLFRNNTHILVSADEVRDGLYDRKDEFVDPEYEFRVQFVKGARNNGGPYFRMYYSYEEYKELYPDRASRYEIIANMRKYEESAWHKKWKNAFSHFCSIEKFIKNEKKNKWKFADAYYEKTKTCIEFQHSYISFDFEERNEFYSNLSINTVWLYNLPEAHVRQKEGDIEILEDNSRGFFRISEKAENLKNYRVYIQVKNGDIYRVRELLRRETAVDRKSTVRYFIPTEVYSESEFVDAVKSNMLGDVIDDNYPSTSEPQTLKDLWNSAFSWVIVRNVEKNEEIFINCNQNGEMFRDYKTDCIKYKYADNKYGYKSFEDKDEYALSHQDEKKAVWVLIKAKIKYNKV